MVFQGERKCGFVRVKSSSFSGVGEELISYQKKYTYKYS